MDAAQFCVILHSLEDILNVLSFWLLQKKLLWTIMYVLMCEHKFSFLSDKCPGVQLLDHMLSACLIFKKTTEVFSRVSVLFHVATGNAWVIQFLHTRIWRYICMYISSGSFFTVNIFHLVVFWFLFMPGKVWYMPDILHCLLLHIGLDL